MNKINTYRVGNIVGLRDVNDKSYYIARIINCKHYDSNVHGVYLEDFWNPNNSRDYTNNIIPRDYSNNIPRIINEIKGIGISDEWLLDNGFVTLDIFNNEEHSELFKFAYNCFGTYNAPDDNNTLIYETSYSTEDGSELNVLILYNRKTYKVHIISYTNDKKFNKSTYKNNFKPVKVFCDTVHYIHVFQNILIDMNINILDQLKK